MHVRECSIAGDDNGFEDILSSLLIAVTWVVRSVASVSLSFSGTVCVSVL